MFKYYVFANNDIDIEILAEEEIVEFNSDSEENWVVHKIREGCKAPEYIRFYGHKLPEGTDAFLYITKAEILSETKITWEV